MKTQDIEDLLSAHADGLNTGQDLTTRLLADQPGAAGRIEPLLQLAGRVQSRITPVEPRADFVANLWARLQPTDVIIQPLPARQPMWVWLVAGIGGLISLASLIVIGIRVALVAARWISSLVNPSPNSMSSAKARVAH